MRRQLGLSLSLAGGLLLSFAGGRYALGAVKADAARAEWERTEARRAVRSARLAALSSSDAPPVAGAPVARIVAPTIGLDAIVLEGVDDDALNAGPGHLPGSAMPGERGNSVVSAHRDRHFSHIDGLAIGDTLITETGMRQTTWVVVTRRVVDKDSRVLFRAGEPTLTLTTCWPMRYVGPAPERLIITARPVRGGTA